MPIRGIINQSLLVFDRANDLKAKLDAGMGLWLLLGTTIDPSPSLTIANLIEPSFAGYARKSTMGIFLQPVPVVPGEYLLGCTPQEFTSLDPTPADIAGWALITANKVYAVGLFAGPQPISLAAPLTFGITWRVR